MNTRLQVEGSLENFLRTYLIDTSEMDTTRLELLEVFYKINHKEGLKKIENPNDHPIQTPSQSRAKDKTAAKQTGNLQKLLLSLQTSLLTRQQHVRDTIGVLEAALLKGTYNRGK